MFCRTGKLNFLLVSNVEQSEFRQRSNVDPRVGHEYKVHLYTNTLACLIGLSVICQISLLVHKCTGVIF